MIIPPTIPPTIGPVLLWPPPEPGKGTLVDVTLALLVEVEDSDDVTETANVVVLGSVTKGLVTFTQLAFDEAATVTTSARSRVNLASSLKY